MAPNLLPWLPTDLTDEVASWDFTHKVSSALSDIGQAGADLMKPIGQQLAALVPDPPAPPPPPPPEPPPAFDVKLTPRYDLGTAEDWGFGLAPAPAPSPRSAAGTSTASTSPQPEQEPVAHAAGSFQLPEPSAFLGQAAETVGQAGRAVGQAAASIVPSPKPPAGATSEPNAYLRQAAARRGIDPDQVSAVMGKEGPGGWGAVGRFDTGTSYGPLQLHYAGGSNPKRGMGDDFTRDTGIDLRTDGSVASHQAAIDYALDRLSKTGDYREWYGADNALGSRMTAVKRVAPSMPQSLGEVPEAARAAGRAAGQAAGQAITGGLDSAGIQAAYKGVAYTFGGPGGRTNAALGVPTDCSGFVSAVWQDRYGVPLVAHTDGAYNQLKGLGAREVEQKDARPGDVVFYMGAGTGGAITHHMGIYAGDGRVLDMSVSGGDGVKERPVGHGGAFIIMRDPRLGESPPRGAPSPPPIVETGVAEVSGGRKPSQARIDAASEAGPIVSPFAAPASDVMLAARNPISEPWGLPFGSLASGSAPEDYSTATIREQHQLSPGTRVPIAGPDGSVMTERSITVDDPDLNAGRATNIPTVWNGAVVSDERALDNARRSGVSWPSYDSIGEAVAAAERRSADLGAGRDSSIGGARLAQPSMFSAVSDTLGRAASGAAETVGRYLPDLNPAPAWTPEEAETEADIERRRGIVRSGFAAAPAAALGAGSAAYEDPLTSTMPGLPRAGAAISRAGQAAGAEIVGAMGEAAAGTDPLVTTPAIETPLGTIPSFSPTPRDVGGVVGGVLGDPTSWVLPGGAADAAADLATRRLAGAIARPAARAIGRGFRRAGAGIGEHLAENAARTAALDAGMAADPAYSATLIVPEGSPVRGRKLRDAPPMDLSEAEAPGFARAAEELSQGRYGPDSAEALDPSHPLEWHDQVVRINNKGQYDGDHPVSLPFYRNGSGDLIPLEPSDVGPMGSPVNSAYNAAVKAAGGRKGFVYGRWRDERGVRHEFDSPQEVVAMVDLDARLAEGAIDSWWSQANNPYPDLEKIPYASTNRDKGGLKNYVPDLIVRHHDGSLEVIEIKSPEVIAKAEEYGMKAGEVSGQMGWDVVKKAAGIMAGLADRGVRYRLMLPHQVLETGRIPLGSNIAGQGTRSRRLDLMPGVDPRDAPKMRKKKITPAEGSAGVEIARVVDETSGRLMDEAIRLKGLGVSDDERLRLLTRMARDDLLPTAELATSAPVPAAAVARGEPAASTTPGRQEGLTRNLLAGGEAPLGSNVRHRGPLGLDDLDEWDPDSGRILREAEEDGGKLTNLAIHDGTDGASRLIYEIDGDPQAAIRASGRLAQYHGADEASRGIWYRDAKGKYPVSGLDFDVPGGDFDAIRAAIADDWPDAPMVVPRYNSGRLLEGIDLYGRALDGAPLRDDVLEAALLRAQAALEDGGIGHRPVPTQRAEMSRFAGEPGHASSPEAAVERAEQLLGRRRITVEQADRAQAAKRAAAAAKRAAERGGAGGGAAVASAEAGQPAGAGAPAGALGRLGGPPSALDVDDLEDLLDEDDLLDAGVSLIGPYPSARARSAASTLGQRALATAGQSLAGGVSGSYLGAGAPAETDEERRRNALVGAGLGLVGGPALSRGIGAVQRRAGVGTRGALATIGAPGAGGSGASFPSTAGGFNLGDTLRRHTGIAAAFDDAGKRAAAMQAHGLEAPSAYDWMKQAAYSGIYSLQTATNSIVGNTAQALDSQGREALRALVERRPASYTAQAKAQVAALPEGIAGLGRVLAGGTAEEAAGRSGGSIGRAGLSERTTNPVGYMLARVLEKPGEVLTEAPDALFRPGFIAQGEAREARRIAAEMGYKGQQATAYADLLQESADRLKANPGARSTSAEAQRVVDAGKAHADELGFKGEPGQFARWLGKQAKQDNLGGVLATILMPFPGMAGRMMTAAGRRTPLVGLAPGLRAGRPGFDVAYDQVTGAVAAGAFATYAAAGGITGSGPSDPNERKMLESQGWSPNSFKLGPYSIPNRMANQWQPLLDTAGELHDALAYGKEDRNVGQLTQELVTRASKIASDQTGLSGLADLAEMFDHGIASHGPGFVARQLVRHVPWGGVLRAAASSLDPEKRRADRWEGEGSPLPAIGEQVATAVPGLRQGVPAAQDVLGRPVPNPQYGLGAFLPAITKDTPDPAIDLFRGANMAIPAVHDTLTVGDIAGVPLTPDEKRLWNTYRGEVIQKYAEKLTANEKFMALPPKQKEATLKEALDAAAEAADGRVIKSMDRADLKRRATETARKKAS